MTSLCFMTVMPSPYQQELFHALHDCTDMDISVFYYVEKPADRNWENIKHTDYEMVLPGKTLSWLGDSVHWNPLITRILSKTNYDLVIISDYSSLTAQVAMWYLTCTGRKWLYWGERPGMRRGLFRGWARQALMLPIRIGASGICAIGSMAEKSYRQLFGDRKLVVNVPYFCDLQRFLNTEKITYPRIKVLYCGQFIERKGVDILLRAFARIARECPEVDLVLAGGTADCPFLQGLISEDLWERIEIAGFHQPEHLPALYAKADIFVLPSRHDGWGIVINEALGAGLPVIASDQAGAAHDLVVLGENGFIYPADDERKLAEYLRLLATSPETRMKFGRASRQRSELFGLEEGVRRWNHVCELVIGK